MAVELRVATLDDLPAVKRLFESVAAEGRYIGTEMPINWAVREPIIAATFTDEHWLLLLAVADGEVVGWISGQDEYGRVGLGMGLLEGHRSQGTGTKLLAAVIGWAKQRNAYKVHLEVWPTNERAIGLYRKFGFEDEGLHRRHYRRNDGSLWDALAMGLVLDEESPGGP
jgi:ribosomal protein S18 acetylase RimI-like enzyme